MSDLISKQRAIKEIDRFIPVDPMMSDYTQGISVGLAIATRCIEEFSQENHDSSQGLVKDLISRNDAIDAVDDIDWYHQNKNGEMVSGANPSDHQAWYKEEDIYNVLESLPSAEPKTPSSGSITSMNTEKMHVRTTYDCISRQEAKDAIDMALDHIDHIPPWVYDKLLNALNEVPSAEQEKEIPRRVLWSGWKGTRYTRYKCPNCNKPVKNDDVYCHRCGQKLMFPHISHTPYIEGQKQELIVRWDDEE